jgi:hypothetical protein
MCDDVADFQQGLERLLYAVARLNRDRDDWMSEWEQLRGYSFNLSNEEADALSDEGRRATCDRCGREYDRDVANDDCDYPSEVYRDAGWCQVWPPAVTPYGWNYQPAHQPSPSEMRDGRETAPTTSSSRPARRRRWLTVPIVGKRCSPRARARSRP